MQIFKFFDLFLKQLEILNEVKRHWSIIAR